MEGPRRRPVPVDKALGSCSLHFIDASVRRLMAATMLPGEFVPTTNSLSAALAFVESMEPENEVQAALAVNAACLQAASTNLLSRIPKARLGSRQQSPTFSAPSIALLRPTTSSSGATLR